MKIPWTLNFKGLTLLAGATTDLVLSAGSAGVLVPSSYSFFPQFVSISSDTDLTAGTATAKVTSDGTAIIGGPEPQLSNTVQWATSEVNPPTAKVAAGARVGAEVVTSAGYLPITSNIDVLISGFLIPS